MSNDTQLAAMVRDKLASRFPASTVDNKSHWPQLNFPSQRFSLLFSRWMNHNNGMVRVSIYADDGHRASNVWPCANVTPSRTTKSLAADIERRVINPALPMLREYYTKQSESEAKAQQLRARVTEISEHLGEPDSYHGIFRLWPSLEIKQGYDITPENYCNEFRATVRVKNWHAFKQIVKILEHDQKLA